MTNRLPVESFSFPVEKIKAGYYTDAYFLRSAEILNGDNYHPRVLMQIFARDNVVVCGTDEVIALIKTCAFHPENIVIHSLHVMIFTRLRNPTAMQLWLAASTASLPMPMLWQQAARVWVLSPMH